MMENLGFLKAPMTKVTKPSTMSKIWVCSECGIAWDKEELDANEHKNWCEDKYLVPHIPFSAVIEMIEKRIEETTKFISVMKKVPSISTERPEARLNELESLKKQIEEMK